MYNNKITKKQLRPTFKYKFFTITNLTAMVSSKIEDSHTSQA